MTSFPFRPPRNYAWLLGLALLSACEHDPQTATEPALSLNPCEIGGGTALCGSLPVPENRARPDGRMIALNVVVIPATGARTEPPLFDLAGGPGLAATPGAAFYLTEGTAYRKHRDVNLFDQRGTGESAPALCPSIGDAGTLAPMYPLDAVRECVELLGQTHDLSQYSTLASVSDLEAVRAAVGAEQLDLFAISYGTRLAQAYIRAYPERVRSAVFWGTISMDPQAPLSHAKHAQAALQSIFKDCEVDPACAAAFPELRNDWESLDRKLRQNQVFVGVGTERKAIARGPFMEAFRTILTVASGPVSRRRADARLFGLAGGRCA